MGLASWLPSGGANLFQEIKRVREEAQSRGVKILNYSIGQPQGPALLSARQTASEAVISDAETMHEYQDNGSPGVPNFAQRFIDAHNLGPWVTEKSYQEQIGFLPIPGIKPMLGLIPLACGLQGKGLSVLTMTNPGYPTPADWCRYLRITPHEPEIGFTDFRFTTETINHNTRLLMLNYPHNPSGQIATREWLNDLCKYCETKGIRLFNDAAYFGLSFDPNSCSLSRIAKNYPDLSWAEAFSASKIIGNGTGWRVGAIVGSKDFVYDIAKVKGNTDSGFAAPMAAGALYALENDQNGIAHFRRVYRTRIGILTEALQFSGMQLAVQPGAGFFTLWKVPKRAFGEEMKNGEHFNFTMIERTGVTGVHFNPGYIRYAVCGNVQAMIEETRQAFVKAEISY